MLVRLVVVVRRYPVVETVIRLVRFAVDAAE